MKLQTNVGHVRSNHTIRLNQACVTFSRNHYGPSTSAMEPPSKYCFDGKKTELPYCTKCKSRQCQAATYREQDKVLTDKALKKAKFFRKDNVITMKFLIGSGIHEVYEDDFKSLDDPRYESEDDYSEEYSDDIETDNEEIEFTVSDQDSDDTNYGFMNIFSDSDMEDDKKVEEDEKDEEDEEDKEYHDNEDGVYDERFGFFVY